MSTLTQARLWLSSISEEQKAKMQATMLIPACSFDTPATFGYAEGGKKVRIKAGGRVSINDLEEYTCQARSELHMVGSFVNFTADHVLRETVCRLKDAGLYRHEVKGTGNALQKQIAVWQSHLKQLLAERYETVESLCSDRLSSVYPDLESMRLQLADGLRRRGCKDPNLAAWVELTQRMFALSRLAVKGIVRRWYRQSGIDFTEVFKHFDLLLSCGSKWQNVCMKFYDKAAQIDLTADDRNAITATKKFYLAACDFDALVPHVEELVCGEYADDFTDEDRERVRRDAADLRKAQAEKAAAARKANADYWKSVKKRAKNAAADITDDDLADLARHFGEWGAA